MQFLNAVNVKDFGATGLGIVDDGPSIQAAFDAAFGPASSPNGNTNRFSNRPVFFPAGNYLVGAPLYLINVVGGQIIGAGMNCTRLAYTGSLSGNTVIANGITPLIMTNGFGYGKISGLNLAMAGANTACLYLYQDGLKGTTEQNTISEVLFEGAATAGALIGYGADSLCSEHTFINCSVTGPTFGYRNISQNALNNNFYNCGAAGCGTGFSIPSGSSQIYGASLAGNGVDIASGELPMTIIGARTESANFVDASVGNPVYLSGCDQAIDAGAGYFVNLGGGGIAILDACIEESSTSTVGKILGSGSSKLYLRGCRFSNASFLASYTGTTSQNI